jgi:hypothetical protein
MPPLPLPMTAYCTQKLLLVLHGFLCCIFWYVRLSWAGDKAREDAYDIDIDDIVILVFADYGWRERVGMTKQDSLKIRMPRSSFMQCQWFLCEQYSQLDLT